MKTINVMYAGWGEYWHLGTLADDGQRILFEYSEHAIQQRLELSPLRLKLQGTAYGDFPAHQMHLPGLVGDALPDGWGLILMDRWFARNGIDTARVSPLDRLGFLGERAMGALSFVPHEDSPLSDQTVALQELAAGAQEILADHQTQTLRQLVFMGGSPQGARPKVLVYRDPAHEVMSTVPMPGSAPWLVKFQARGEHKEVCAIEHLYAALATDCGLDMPQTDYIDLDAGLAAFCIRRFDIEAGMRVPVHTVSGLLHQDFRQLGLDYTNFLRAVRFMTRDVVEVRKAFARAVFNVLFNNRDDHGKNFSFRLDRQRQWKLAPCYDLSFNPGPGGQHTMAIMGHGHDITRAQLLALAKSADLDARAAGQCIDHFLDVAQNFAARARHYPIRDATQRVLATHLAHNAKLLT